MMMWPACRSAQPNTGTFVSSFFATQRSWNSGSAATTARTSKWLWWFDMNTYGVVRIERGLVPGADTHARHQEIHPDPELRDPVAPPVR